MIFDDIENFRYIVSCGILATTFVAIPQLLEAPISRFTKFRSGPNF
jgi:hypothetical protein